MVGTRSIAHGWSLGSLVSLCRREAGPHISRRAPSHPPATWPRVETDSPFLMVIMPQELLVPISVNLGKRSKQEPPQSIG